jgi:outer membrane protein assembly factor BamA
MLIVIAVIFLSGCKTTKYVPENNYLLDHNYLKIDGKGINKKDLELLFKQKPNKRILGFRFHLGLYNLSKPGNKKWPSKWFRKIGEEPIIFDEELKNKTIGQISLFLKNKGYYNSVVTDTVLFKKKSVRVYYKIKTGIPYTINRVEYKIEDTAIARIICPDSINCLLRPGIDFNVDIMQSERIRIESILKNRGYYRFTKEYIQFEADSVLGNNKVNLVLRIKQFQLKNSDGEIKSIPFVLYKLGKIKVIFERKPIKDTLEDYLYIRKPDSITLNNIQVIFQERVEVKPSLIDNNIYIAPGQLYSQRYVDESYRSLLSLKIFKFINITFTEDTTVASGEFRIINCRIQLATTEFQSYQTEVELTNSSGIGVAGSLNYQHKNLFKGAEIFNFKINGATEAIKKTEVATYKSTLELGAQAKIEFPKFMLPFKTEQFIRRYNPKTSLSVAYNYKRRPTYNISVANFSFGYNWYGNRYNNLTVNPIDINYVKLDTIQNFYNTIKSPYLLYSYTDHLVSVTSFGFTFNNQKFKKNSEFYFFRLNFEAAGNTLRMLNKIIGARTDSNNAYHLFSVPFSQYIRGDVDYRFYLPLNQTDRMVYRIFIGVAYPYGNSKSVPFEKQYFSGGANSIRAWQALNLGPGSYKDTTQTSYYPNKTGDIKLEGNLEYRFKLFWVLEGAFFTDIGNIWSINTKDPREGAVFYFDKFINQIAVGVGFGTRFDFSFFIFRLDVGLKLRDPSLINHPWLFNRSKSDTRNYKDILHFTVGIGYPF